MDFIIRDSSYFKKNILERVAENLDSEINKYISDVIKGSVKLEDVDSLGLRRILLYENKELIENEIIQDLIKELDEVNQKFWKRNRFSLSDNQEDKIKLWEETHECKNRGKHHGAIGGQYTYKFTPTSIGTFCEVKCSCGETIDVSEI